MTNGERLILNCKKAARKGLVVAGALSVTWVALTGADKLLAEDFSNKIVNYPEQIEEYDTTRYIVEVDNCNWVDKLTIGNLKEQKEVPVLCTYETNIPEVSAKYIDEADKLYVVGDLNKAVEKRLENLEIEVVKYDGVLGLIKTHL